VRPQPACTGTFFSTEDAGVTPDMIVLSKSISGFGLPMALVLVRPEWDQWAPGEHNGTFRGNSHAFVTARTALEKFWSDDRFALDIARRAAMVRERLDGIALTVPGARVKGRGMMQGVDVGHGSLAAAICGRAGDSGLIIETSGADDEVVKVLAPLTTPDELLTHGLDILEDSVVASLRRVAVA
jgi:diaminobutyrate-2-oxoglutarate transaminase